MKDIEKSLLVQQDQLKRSEQNLGKLTCLAKEVQKANKEQSDDLEELDQQMGDLYSTLGMNRDEQDLEEVSVSNKMELAETELQEVDYKLPKFQPVPIIGGLSSNDDWQAYGKEIDMYMEKYQLDLSTDPIKQMLTVQQIKGVEGKFHQQFGDVRWNKWDYTVVGIAALVGFLVDYLVVKLPAGVSEKYVPPGSESPVGKWLNKLTSTYLDPENNSKLKDLEKWAKTPYDAVKVKEFERIIPETAKIKINPNLHRLKTVGHDPVLQLVFGVLDCMRGTMTVFDQNGNLAVLNNPGFGKSNLFVAIIKTLAHFVTDVGTKRGVVPPFFSITQAITVDTPFDINDRGVTRKMKLNELAERMYTHGGYNFNHFLTMSLVPLTVEMIIRGYHWITNPSTEMDLKRDYKLSSMLTMGHSLTMSGNVIKLWLSAWNPLAFNYSQMLMLTKSFYSLYMAKLERDHKIECTLLINWEEIHNRL
ncbi:hypothetical protein ACJ2A9_19405 [Anaerobacillus sp. MEB173]|uniref:hypothetical protein n=1 Tax=Anaerobacillus sp. MEB173 TaxID=3383345 RepID=UPI003F8F6E3B